MDNFQSADVARLLEGGRDGIAVLDLDGCLLTASSVALRALDLEGARGAPFAERCRAEDRSAAKEALEAARRGEPGAFVARGAAAADGRVRWWEVSVSAILDARGQPERLLALLRDVTDWKRGAELLRVLTEATAVVTGREFFRSLARQLAQALDVRFAFVAECLALARARSLAFWQDDAYGADFEYDLRGTPCLEVSRGNVCHVPDRLPERFPEDAGMIALGTVSYLGVPITSSQHRVIGHLVIFDDKVMAADPLVESVMKTMAARAGAELERQRAEDRERAILAVNNAIISSLTQRSLLGATAAALERALPYDRAALTLYDAEKDTLTIQGLEGRVEASHFVVGMQLPRQGTHVGWAIEHRRTLLRRDLGVEREFASEDRLYAEGVRSMCTAPMLLAGRSIGTLIVGSFTPGRYSEEDAELLQEAANQVALAIANMRAFEEIAALKARLQAENLYLQEEIRSEHNFEEIVGNSPALLELLRQVDPVARTDSTVLITGETGTGKELIARALHDRSTRKERPLVKVNCGAISAGLVESELFGHVKGAFTGALAHRDGRFKLADGGSIFLDEVGELPLDTQAKLLRVLQEQEFEPVGSSATVRVDVRIIAATNRDLAAAVRQGTFRSDLFYRLNVFPLHVPSLRERSQDVPLLVTFFLQRFAKKFGRPVHRVDPQTLAKLAAYEWPGNVRELRNVVERAVVLSDGETLSIPGDLGGGEIRAQPAAAPPPAAEREPAADQSLEEMERRHIEAVLERTHWIIEGDRGAASALGLHPSTLRSRMRKLGIRRQHHS